MDDYFPGIMDELGALGAPRGDVVGDFLWFQYGRSKLRHDWGLRGITVSRPCLEGAIRRRVKALPNVTFLEGALPRPSARGGIVRPGRVPEVLRRAESAGGASCVDVAPRRVARPLP